MTREEKLVILRKDLQIATSQMDDYLGLLLDAAVQMIEREGISLTDSTEDAMLEEMYAAYLYRKRRENTPMPRMLRYVLNNRLFQQKAREDG